MSYARPCAEPRGRPRPPARAPGWRRAARDARRCRPTKIPNADRTWHPIAKRLWDSLKESGQADFYQASDWALAYSLCEDLSFYKKSGKRSGQMLQTIYSAFERLLVAEGDRRRVRVELHEPEPEEQSAAVLAIADYKKDLGL
ncbi:phage terminase small subunit [Streptomyces sp. IBSNAI002]|uniref:phage terminase small subunit n=1 Tax=Streptomyces sp. IBSNAI002 TaxID=3457500 RepID=UPI003FCF7EDF